MKVSGMVEADDLSQLIIQMAQKMASLYRHFLRVPIVGAPTGINRRASPRPKITLPYARLQHGLVGCFQRYNRLFRFIGLCEVNEREEDKGRGWGQKVTKTEALDMMFCFEA